MIPVSKRLFFSALLAPIFALAVSMLRDAILPFNASIIPSTNTILISIGPILSIVWMFYTPLSPKAKMFFLGYLLALSNTSGLYTLVEFTGAGGYALSLAIVMIPFVFIIYMLVFFVVKIIKKFRQNAQARVIDTSNHNSF